MAIFGKVIEDILELLRDSLRAVIRALLGWLIHFLRGLIDKVDDWVFF